MYKFWQIVENLEGIVQLKPSSSSFPFLKYTHTMYTLRCKIAHFTSQNQVIEKTHKKASSFPQTQGPKKKNTHNLQWLCLQPGKRSRRLEWQRRQGPILTTYTMHYIRATLFCLPATEHSLIYMIIGGRRAQRDNKGKTTMPSSACRKSDLRCNLLQREQRERKEKGRERCAT